MDADLSPFPPRYLVQNTHDGLVLDFPRRPPASVTILLGLFGWIVVGWLSLWLLALPVADLVETQRWWDVNEAVLQFRWMAIGMPLWPLLFSLGWLWARGPAKLRVKVDQHAIRWRGRFGWRRLAWSELRGVSVRSRCLALTTQSGQVRLLPALPAPVLRSLYRFVLNQWAAAHTGRSEEVPPELQDLARQAAEFSQRAASLQG